MNPGEDHTFSISLIHDESEMVLISDGGEFRVETRLTVAEFALAVVNNSFPKPGLYTAIFAVDRRQLVSRKLELKLRTETGG